MNSKFYSTRKRETDTLQNEEELLNLQLTCLYKQG